MKRIGAAFLTAILLLSSTPLLFHRVPGSSSTDIRPAISEAQISFSGSPSSINWFWENPDNIDFVVKMSISADGSYLVALTHGDKVYLFHKSSSTPVWTYSAGWTDTVKISADGNYIVVGGENLWLFGKDDNTPVWENDIGTIYSVAVSSDGSYIAAANGDDKVLLFGKSSSVPIRTYNIDAPERVSISADGQYIAVGTWSSDDSVYLLDKDSSVPIWRYSTDDDVWSVAISADGSHVAAIDNRLYLFGNMENRPIWTFGTSYIYGAVAISSDGSRVAVAESEGVHELTENDNAPLWTFEPWAPMDSVAISSDGKYVAAGFSGSNAYLFRELGRGKPIKDYYFQDGYVLAMSQAADYIAFGRDNGINFREVVLPEEIFTFLTVDPPTFTLGSENSITLKATLTSKGAPLAGKTITWTTNAGILLPTSGTTNENGQVSTTYKAPSVTTHASVTISASFAADENYEGSSGNSSGTINPAGPVSALIESYYNGFFLHDVNAITNTYTVTPPPEENVVKVVFQMDGDTQIDNTSPYKAEYNMGNVGLHPTLNVTVHLTDGRTLSDNLSPVILDTPTILSQMINFFDGLGQVDVSKKPNGCWKMRVAGIVPVVKAALSVTEKVVPFDVGFGNYDLPISDWSLGFTIEGDDYNKEVKFGSVNRSIDDMKIMDYGGLSFDAELSGGFTVLPEGRNENITAPTITISTSGHVSFTYYYETVVWCIPITVTVSPYFGAGLGISLGADNPIKVVDVNGDIYGGVEVSAGVGVPGLSVGAYFDGTIYLYVVAVPEFAFDKVTVTAAVGLYAEAFCWRGEVELWDGSWSSDPNDPDPSASESAGEWELNERRYLGPSYSTFAWTAGNREGALVENVYSNPQPSLAVAENGSMVAAWTYDDPGKDLLQALEIAYLIYDPERGAWSAPATITSDNLFDSNPKLAYIGNGRVLAVWQRVPHQLENTASPFAFVENIELAYSILDLNTGGWSTPQLITSNNTYEAPPAIASCGGKTWLVYLRDSDGNLFTLDNQTLVAVEWAGGSWGAEETLASGITVIGSPRLSLAGANDGILTFVQDMDDNLSTLTDREIFYIQYDGNWGTPTRLTTDNIWEESPSAGRANNRWYLSWIEMKPVENTSKYTTSVRFAKLTNGQLTEKGTLFENQGVTDQSLLGEIQDKLYLLYQVDARGTPRLIRYDGNAWENVENFQWSPKVENARTSQLSVAVGGNHLGAVGVTEVQAGGGQTFASLHASTFSLYPPEAPPEIAATPWALIGGIIAALIVVGIIVAAIFSRRKRTISAVK